MKRTFANIRTLAAVLMASAALVACNKEYNATAEQTPQVYTIAIQAGMDSNAQTKALELDGTKLVAKWAEGDELMVFNVNLGAPLGGTLTASNVSADGKKCTFSGTLTGTISPDDDLMFFYHETGSPQDGTLASAAANDKANATVKVATVDEGNITITGGTATFKTVTTILKLTLKDGSSNALNATNLTISVDGVDFFSVSPTAATYTANGNGVLYFVVPTKDDLAFQMSVAKVGNPSEAATWETYLETYPVTFTATVGSDTYTATKTGYELAAGKYYATTLTMAKSPIDLSTLIADYEAKDGETLTGTLGSNVKISIADGATVTLKDVNINGSGTWTSGDYAGITCAGDATITLEGTNTVKGFAGDYPGIFVSSGKTLVINGTGELNASSNGSSDPDAGGAGIGGGNIMNCGNIEIQSGTVTATGNQYGAGIGGGQNANCGNITISGGTVTATGGYRAAGIGGGRRGASGTSKEYDSGSCGNITISGGTITATGGEDAAGIGGGRGNNPNMNSSCGTITITSGVTSVTATKGGTDAPNSIGAGRLGICGAVTIEDNSKVTQN
jgi:hypothetical protein